MGAQFEGSPEDPTEVVRRQPQLITRRRLLALVGLAAGGAAGGVWIAERINDTDDGMGARPDGNDAFGSRGAPGKSPGASPRSPGTTHNSSTPSAPSTPSRGPSPKAGATTTNPELRPGASIDVFRGMAFMKAGGIYNPIIINRRIYAADSTDTGLRPRLVEGTVSSWLPADAISRVTNIIGFNNTVRLEFDGNVEVTNVGAFATYAAAFAGREFPDPLDAANLKRWGILGYNYPDLNRAEMETAMTTAALTVPSYPND